MGAAAPTLTRPMHFESRAPHFFPHLPSLFSSRKMFTSNCMQSKARLMSQFSHQSETEIKNTSTEDFMAILERNSAILQQATEKNQELAAKQNESKQSTEATGSKI